MDRFYGTENYIQYIIEKHSDTIFRISYSYMKSISEAEDITQEVFIKLLEKKPSFESDEQEKAWLIRVTINLCKDRLKSSWFKRRVPLEGDFVEATKEDNEIISAAVLLFLIGAVSYKLTIANKTYEQAISIPKIELPSDGGVAKMIPLIVYKRRVYTMSSTTIEPEDGKKLLGEKLGTTKGNIDEWSKQDEYSKEFASTVGIQDVYTVKGYDKNFRIMA